MARKFGNWHVIVRGIDGSLLIRHFYPKKKMALKMFRELGEEYNKTHSIEEMGKLDLDNGIYIKFTEGVQVILFKGESIKPYLGGV